MSRIGILTCSNCTQDTNCAYDKIIRENYPELEIVHGTHTPKDKTVFRGEVKELLCPKVSVPQDMNDVIKKRLIIK